MTKQNRTRRNFMKTTLALGAASTLGVTRGAHAASSDVIKIGLIGCGGRGSGAVVDAMTIDPNVKLIAAADVFRDRGQASLDALKTQYGDRIAVGKDRFFVGFDAYKKVLETDCDSVILATPQHFRPMTLKAAIAAGKHVFAEKPVAVDGAGIRMILEAAQEAQKKKLNLVSGLVNRYHPANVEVAKHILDGDIGDVVCVRAQRMGGSLWKRPRVEGDTEMQYQMRNWVNFNWIASDYINDCSIHQIDVGLWCMKDPTPECAIGMGGRIARHEIDTGDMYDTLAVTYEFADGRFLQAYSRQIPGTWPDMRTYIYGTKGRAIIQGGGRRAEIIGPKPLVVGPSEIRGQKIEHKVLFDAMRSGGSVYVNNGTYMANSTMTCILGKLAVYTGKKVTWAEAMAYEEKKPTEYSWDGTPPTLPDARGQYKIAIPNEGWAYM
ncbi:MAG: Gfo/Idh/MocA family oxidoreductase [Planctomycetia bacterium]|nr:Gfo/Idh/MocA family oxidoreductase [Planctomycetia bacterium]